MKNIYLKKQSWIEEIKFVPIQSCNNTKSFIIKRNINKATSISKLRKRGKHEELADQKDVSLTKNEIDVII